jgi:hypothetical protein
LATEGQSQRRWRAACPNCGAPVEFASAASPVAVCSYCRSTLARDGESLRRIGEMAELFDDHSPLQIGSAGRWQGAAFTLIGRLQLEGPLGRWNEWHALFDTGRSGWLVEDNGRHVLSFEAPAPSALPEARALSPGQALVLDGRPWAVASIVPARLTAAEGELPAPPVTDRSLTVVELRNAQGEVASFDDARQPPARWALGRAVELPDLALTGLRGESEATLGSRSLACPSCGAALLPRLDGSRSIVCGQCRAVVDLSGGPGADLAHFAQAGRGAAQPLLPLGTTGRLALAGRPAEDWQVVGFMVRREESDDEPSSWTEYLLYRRARGFAFLVNSDEGWSWVTTITGVPVQRGRMAQWEGRSYQQKYSYGAVTTHVLGEFYWPVKRDQRSRNTDYASGRHRLNREEADGEITWSAGETLDGAVVARAFGLPEQAHPALARETVPIGSAASPVVLQVVIVVVVLMVLASMLSTCSGDDCDDVRATFGAASNEYQQCRANAGSGSGRIGSGGGSWSGGHK